MSMNGRMSPVPTIETVLPARKRRVVRGSGATGLIGSPRLVIGSCPKEPIGDNWLVLTLDSHQIATLLGWGDEADGPLFRRLAEGLRRLAGGGYLPVGGPPPPGSRTA